MSEPADLFEVLRLPPDVSDERLRFAYEGAVAAASRRGDWQRAGQLSSAFDALGADRRQAVYAGHGRTAPRWGCEPDASPRRARHRRRQHGGRAERGAPAARREVRDAALTARWQMRRPYRILALLIVASVAVAMFASSVRRPHPQTEWPLFAFAVAALGYSWLNHTEYGRAARRRLGQALQLVVWSAVAGLLSLIVVLAVLNARR